MKKLTSLTKKPKKLASEPSPPFLSLLELCKTIKQAFQVHAQIIINGFHLQMFIVSKLISFSALLGSKDGLTYSQNLFCQFDHPNHFMYNTMIRGLSHSEFPEKALVFYSAMLQEENRSPNNFTYPFLLNSCSKLSTLKPGIQVHCHIIKFGFELDLFIRNALMHFYSVFKRFNDAQIIFEGSLVRDLVSYNTMINGSHFVGQPGLARRLFREMQDSGIQPDEFTFVALLSAFSCSPWNDSRIVKQIHGFVDRNLCRNSNVLLKTAILDFYAKCGLMELAERVFNSMASPKPTAAWSSIVSGYARLGETGAARRMFDQMDERDAICWTAMISGYSQSGQYTEALELFVQMESSGIKPDEVTMATVLSACAGIGALSFGERFHRYIDGDLCGQNIILATALTDMYSKCGKIDSALDMFYSIPEDLRTVSLCNSMISGLALHGLGEQALAVFREMESIKLKPDKTTFVAILSACSHSGLIEQGRELFKLMADVYGIEPCMEHYGCMVDLLSRDGCLDEAYDLIQTMPFEANSVIWRALLGACKLHGNVRIGEVASQKLIELDPDHGARYVLLSNMLANSNQWEEAGRVRKVMADRGVQKLPGWSYIELQGTLHHFLASDRSQLQDKEIKAMLQDMAMHLKSAGYVPECLM